MGQFINDADYFMGHFSEAASYNIAGSIITGRVVVFNGVTITPERFGELVVRVTLTGHQDGDMTFTRVSRRWGKH